MNVAEEVVEGEEKIDEIIMPHTEKLKDRAARLRRILNSNRANKPVRQIPALLLKARNTKEGNNIVCQVSKIKNKF